MRILHVGPVDWQRPSGMNSSIPGIVGAQSMVADAETALLTVSQSPQIPQEVEFPVFEYTGQTLATDLPGSFSSPDLIVFHSTYLREYPRIARYAVANKIPYIITPRGGLTREAQHSKRLKKMVANLTAFRSYFSNAAGYHFLTEGEAAESRRWDRPYFIAGNGVSVPEDSELASPGKSTTLQFVFIGRIDMNIKGLDLLVEACSLISRDLVSCQATIKLFGALHRDDTERLKSLIISAGLNELIHVLPRISKSERNQVLKESDVFLLPSRTEGHPMAALEALAFGVPCLVSESARIGDEISGAGAGWVTGLNPISLAECMLQVIKAKHELSRMGLAGRSMVRCQYSWSTVAAQSLRGYSQLLEKVS